MKKTLLLILAVCMAVLPLTASAVQAKTLGEAVLLPVFTKETPPAEMLQNDGEGVLAALFLLELEKNTSVKNGLPFFMLESFSDKKAYAGVDQNGRAFSAFPDGLNDDYLVVALDGKMIVSLGHFTDNELSAFLKESKNNKSMAVSYLIGSWQGLCAAIGLDPSPYNY